MRVLMTHNYYQQAGGEDAVVAAEQALLADNSVDVLLYEQHNDSIKDMSPLRVAADTLWSRRTITEISALIAKFRPDVIHSHNTFPLISPSLYFAAARHDVPVVQTLHNFRLFCPQAMFLRNGSVCEDCLGVLPWRGIARACYRDSRTQTAMVAGVYGLHRITGTYHNKVTRYIALNKFSRDKFVEAGLPGSRMAVKPNFVDLPQISHLPQVPPRQPRAGGLFVGRLSPEKGVSTLAQAARQYAQAAIEVIGSGPQQAELENIPGIHLRGWQEPPAIYAQMRRAAYLVLPSVCYENFPRALAEAFASGLPVIASRLGAMAEIVCNGETGLLFDPGNPADLAHKLQWADSHPAAMRQMGEAAYREYQDKYTPGNNFTQLMAIYDDAIHAKQAEAA